MHLSQTSDFIFCESFNLNLSDPQVRALCLPGVQLKIVRCGALGLNKIKFY